MNEVYAFGKISEAVEILALHPGLLRERLFSAGSVLLTVHPEMVATKYRREFLEVIRYLTHYEAPEGVEPLLYNMKRRRTRSAIPIAKKLWSLYFRMRPDPSGRNE